MKYTFGMRTLFAAFMIVVSACGGSSASPGSSLVSSETTYPIRFHRPFRVGDRRHVTSEATRRQARTITVQGRVVESLDTETTVSLEGVAEVIAIDEHGKASEERYRIESCTVRDEHGTRSVLTNGQVIDLTTARRADDARIRVDGRASDAEMRAVLSTVLTTTRSPTIDDDVFGTSVPRSVGERWQPDVAAIAGFLGDELPMRFDPARLHADARVVERTRVDGVDGLTIEEAIDADGVDVHLALPPEATVRSSHADIHLGGFFPLETSMPLLRTTASFHLTMAMSVQTPDGQGDVLLDLSMSQRRSDRPLDATPR